MLLFKLLLTRDQDKSLQDLYIKKKKKKRLVHWPGHNHILEDSLDMKTFSSVTQSCPTLCYPIDCSTPGLPVHHQLPEPTQTRVH